MKPFLYSMLLSITAFTAKAQLVAKSACGVFMLDLLDGKLNGLKPSARWQEIKDKLPCSTASQAEGDTSRCGAGVFFKDKDVYFFTDRDYIEVGDKFQGKCSIPIFGANRNSLFRTLGNPKMKDSDWDAFEMSYGTLVLRYNKAGRVNKLQISTRSTETLKLCDQPR